MRQHVCICRWKGTAMSILWICWKNLEIAPEQITGACCSSASTEKDGDEALLKFLRAMTNYDIRIAHEVKSRNINGRICLVRNTPVSEEECHLLYASIFDRVGTSKTLEWEQHFELLRKYMSEHRTISQKTMYDGISIGRWANQQKDLMLKGKLTSEQITKLGKLPGWKWKPKEGLTIAEKFAIIELCFSETGSIGTGFDAEFHGYHPSAWLEWFRRWVEAGTMTLTDDQRSICEKVRSDWSWG